ncbi:MAG: hypothetical protein M1839_008559 [Geoglossum umbratile]|nr:MAG: hypothetical protein M1839_008559 [Geoglossum umbratile]
MALSSCIASGRCSDSDFSIARSSYTDACSVVATGGTPTTAAAVHSTGKSGSGSRSGTGFPAQTGDAGSDSGTHGPRVGVIAAVTGGVVFLIAALVIGGFFLFRRRRDRAPAPVAADSVPLQPTNNNPSPPPDYKASSYPQEADGVAIPGHPGYTPPPLPPGRYEAPANDAAGPSPAWQAQGYMVSDYNKPARGAYVELGGDAHVPPPTPPQQYPPYQYQQQQPYQRPLPGGGGNGPVFELGGPGR